MPDAKAVFIHNLSLTFFGRRRWWYIWLRVNFIVFYFIQKNDGGNKMRILQIQKIDTKLPFCIKPIAITANTGSWLRQWSRYTIEYYPTARDTQWVFLFQSVISFISSTNMECSHHNRGTSCFLTHSVHKKTMSLKKIRSPLRMGYK